MCVCVCVCVCILLHGKDSPSGCLILRGNVAVLVTEGWFLLLAGEVLVVGSSQLSLCEKSLLLSPLIASVAATATTSSLSVEEALEWLVRQKLTDI